MTTTKVFSDHYKRHALKEIIRFVVYLKLGGYMDLVSFKELAWYLGMKNKKYNKLSMEDFESLFESLDGATHKLWKLRAINSRWVYLE
jgi:hypothetical protein